MLFFSCFCETYPCHPGFYPLMQHPFGGYVSLDEAYSRAPPLENSWRPCVKITVCSRGHVSNWSQLCVQDRIRIVYDWAIWSIEVFCGFNNVGLDLSWRRKFCTSWEEPLPTANRPRQSRFIVVNWLSVPWFESTGNICPNARCGPCQQMKGAKHGFLVFSKLFLLI